jgi:hypothetical protein
MSTFLDSSHSTRHAGAERFEAAFDNVQQVRHSLSGSRGLATLLLSAVAAAVMVVAYQVMDSVAEGHLLVMWMALWATAFAALALFAGSSRNLAARLKAGLDGWSHSMARARADERLMAAAAKDPRVMADLRIAIDRASQSGTNSGKAAPAGLEPQFERIGTRARRLARLYY